MRAGSKTASRAACSLTLVLAMVGRVAAAPATEADQAFQRGRTLMKAKRYAEACAAFEQSQRLDPQLGTLFNLANCDVEIGKLASAWRIYREIATSDANADRKALSRDLAAKLEPRLPRLLITTPAAPPALSVALDGVESTALIGVATPIDVGEHRVAASAEGFLARLEFITVKEGELARLTLTLARLEMTPAVAGATASNSTQTAEASSSYARYGAVLTIGGAAVIATGLVIGGFALSDYHSAQEATGSNATSKSRHAVVLGNVSTAFVLLGLIPTGLGLYLWRTSGSAAVVTPAAGADHAGMSIVGTF